MKSLRPWTKEELQEIVNLPTHLVAVITSDEIFAKIGPLGEKILGWEAHEIQDENVRKFIHPDDWHRTSAKIHELLLNTEELATEFTNRCLHKDQTYRWFSWTARASNGRVYSLGTDITEKMQFKEELNIQTLVLDNITEGVIICSVEGEIIYINSAERSLFGYTSKELLGKNIRMLNALNHEETNLYLKDVYNSLKQKGVWVGEWLNQKKNGETFTTSCRVTHLSLKGTRHLVIVQRDITLEKLRQKEQDELRNRFKIFFEQSILPMEIYDLAGNQLVVNQSWRDLFHLNEIDITEFNILTHPKPRELGIIPYFKRAYSGEAICIPTFYIDIRETYPDARPRWVEGWIFPILDEQKKVKELALILKDVTEERENSEKLRLIVAERERAEKRLTMAVKAGKIGIWEWDPGSDKVYWDESLCEIYGFAPGTFTGEVKEYDRLMYPDDREILWQKVKDATEKAIPYAIEHRIFRRDGQVRWIQGSGTTLRDECGKVVLLMGTAIDITDKKIASQDQEFLSSTSEILSSSLNYLENLQKMADLSINYFCDGCLIDQLLPDGIIKRIIVSACTEEVRERMFKVHQDFPQRYNQDHPLFIALSSGKTMLVPDIMKYSLEQKRYKTERYFDELRDMGICSVLVVRLKGKENLLGTITFFTTKGSRHTFDARSKWLAEELAYRTSMSIENSLLYLHSQEAIRARDEFVSIASHELKTPLTSLTLQNQMRKRQLQKDKSKILDEETFAKMLDADDGQLRRITRLIDDMLDISRIRAERLTIHKEKFEFCAFITDVLERLNPQLESAGCFLTVELCSEVFIRGDSYRIEQVVVNLLTNAMKYGAGRPIHIKVMASPVKVTLLVSDEGSGIDPKDIERIFQRFERAVSGSEVSGLGLGLYISRQIVELHDGALFVSSQPGVGSTFIMELPIGHD